MAGEAERSEGLPAEYGDVEAHIAGRPLTVSVEGVPHIITHPGNFPYLFDAYLNLGADVPVSLVHSNYQEYLASDPHGQTIAEALDRIVQDEGLEETIHKALGRLTDEERAYHYSKMIDAAAAHLPPELDAGILRDPRLAEEAA